MYQAIFVLGISNRKVRKAYRSGTGILGVSSFYLLNMLNGVKRSAQYS